MSAYQVWVPGEPVPQGSVRGYVRGGRAVVTSDNPRLRSWRQDVHDALRAKVTEFGTIAGPVEVRLEFTILRPKSHFGRLGLRPSAPLVPDRKPDVDKLVRSCFDAMTTSRAIEDDSRVVTVRATKRYAADEAEPGCWITLVPFTWEDRS